MIGAGLVRNFVGQVNAIQAAVLALFAASGGASLVGYVHGGAGAVPRTVQAKERDRISVKDFGAVGDGVADDTAAMQAAINAASFKSNRVHAPAGVYAVSKLYFQYDATNNPGFNPANRAQGRILFEGDGQCDDGQAITADWDESGTTIVCSATPGIIASKAVAPYPIRALQLSHLTVVGNGAGPVIDFASVHTNSALRYLTVVQQHKDGHGVRWVDSYMVDAIGLYIINTANGGDFTGANAITGHGFILKNPTLAGGQYNLSQLTVQGFKRGYEFGEYNSAVAAQSCAQISAMGVQALKCDIGYDIGKGTTDLSALNLRAEQSVTRGGYVHGLARNITIQGRFSNPGATDCDFKVGNNGGDAVDDAALNVTIRDSTFSAVNVCGIRFVVASASTAALSSRNNRFVAAVAAAGTGVECTAATISMQRHAPVVERNVYTSLATNITGPYVNAAGSRPLVNVKNASFGLDNPANGLPDDWASYSGVPAIGTGVDPYGSGKSYRGSTGGTDAPIYQVITFPANSLLRFSFWSKSIAAAVTPRVRLTDPGASAPTIQDLDTVAPATAALRDVYWYSGANTSARLELRGAEFSMLQVENLSSE